MHNFSNGIVGPGPGAMLIYKFDCMTIVIRITVKYSIW